MISLRTLPTESLVPFQPKSIHAPRITYTHPVLLNYIVVRWTTRKNTKYSEILYHGEIGHKGHQGRRCTTNPLSKSTTWSSVKVETIALIPPHVGIGCPESLRPKDN
jgi:hypothetical protein